MTITGAGFLTGTSTDLALFVISTFLQMRLIAGDYRHESLV